MKKYLLLCIIWFSPLFASLIHPPDESVLNYTHVMFQWEAVENATEYELELSSSSDFSIPLKSYKVYGTKYSVTDKISWESTYYWRVRAVGGSWHGAYSFTTSSSLSDVSVVIYDSTQYATGNTIFGSADGFYSAVIDMYGNEIWNSGDDNIIYYNISDDGMFYGAQYNGALEYPYPGVKFSLIEPEGADIIWQEPNEEYVHHELIELPWGDYMGIAHVVELGPICAPFGGDYWIMYQADGYSADCITNEYPWWGDHLIIWDKDTKEVVWEWSTFDHYNTIDYDSNTWDSAVPYTDNYYDWTHINAFYFDKRDNSIYISTRNLSRITKIQYPSGDIIWNMGRESTSGEVQFGHDLDFSYQHSISLTDEDNILIFDNGVYAPEYWGAGGQTSRALAIEVVGSDGNYSANLAFEYILPEHLFGLTAGNAQQLENGNYLISTIANEGTSLEVTSSGDLVWEANYSSYMLWRANRITKCPALLGDPNDDGAWNVQDIVILALCVLNTNCAVLDVELGYGCAGDINEDGFYNVLDIVTLANCVLAENCNS